jgi:acetyltransferase-like isoleucine patch superfamily enzyme
MMVCHRGRAVAALGQLLRPRRTVARPLERRGIWRTVGAQITERLRQLADRGVTIVDPRQTFVAPDVVLERICGGSVLHPGTRLEGARTFVAPGAHVGAQGPATLVNAVLGPDAHVDAGYVNGAVLLDRARAGWGAHFRPGTLLEEEASTAHAVGLKHTILLAFVTIGSLVNFCDVLMSGGTSRQDHSEVGSGFIHFNFTPWGARGDKATPSLVGDVTRGVLLRSPRIFLGGAGGMVGPTHVGMGAITAAGQVVRADVPARRLVLEPPRRIDAEVQPGRLEAPGPRCDKNVAYLGQLVALQAWYRDVRLRRIPASSGEHDACWVQRTVVTAALETLELCIEERVRRLEAFLHERDESPVALRLDTSAFACPIALEPADPRDPADHLAWVRALPTRDVERLEGWLTAISGSVGG